MAKKQIVYDAKQEKLWSDLKAVRDRGVSQKGVAEECVVSWMTVLKFEHKRSILRPGTFRLLREGVDRLAAAPDGANGAVVVLEPNDEMSAISRLYRNVMSAGLSNEGMSYFSHLIGKSVAPVYRAKRDAKA